MNDFVVSDFFTGDKVRIDGKFSHLDEVDASCPGSLVYCQSLRYLDVATTNSNVSAIITTPALAAHIIHDSKALIVTDNPRFEFFTVYVDFYRQGLSQPQVQFGVGKDCRIHPSAVVSSKARIGDRVEIGPGVVIEDFVQVMDGVFIGSNVVIGAEGLVTLRHADGSLLMVKHIGSVSIGKGTVILAGAVVAKSLFPSPTIIGDHCQIGIMVTIGHGVSIGQQSVISGNTVIAGRTKVGSKVWMGASSSIRQGLTIGDGAQIKMGSVVVADVAPGAIVSGNFAVSHKANMRHFFSMRGR